MDLRRELIRLGEELASERDAANDLWSWLPSHAIATQHHGDCAYEFCPSIAEVMYEACTVLSMTRGYTPSVEEQVQMQSCPCGDAHEADDEEK